MELSIQKLFCQNQMAARFLRPPSKNEPLILAIPGGPCLSGRYLDQFLIKLAEEININVGIIDLPNHGDSVLLSGSLPLSYKNCFDLINAMLNELAEEAGKLILFGQSFGARLAFDLLAFSKVNIMGGFLTGFPYKFQISEVMLEKIKLIEVVDEVTSEEGFKNNWSRILPLYTVSALSDEIIEALTSNIMIKGNEHILDDVPDIKFSAGAFLRKSILPQIAILQGDADGIVPDDNLLKLKDIVPQAQFFEIEKCGHFSMVENSVETIRCFSEFYFSTREIGSDK